MKAIKQEHVLFVCAGNTCRSPSAKFIMDEEAKRLGVAVITDSAGLFFVQNAPINIFAKAALAMLYNREFMNYSKPASAALMKWADTVYSFTDDLISELNKLYPNDKEKIRKLNINDISDPFGMDRDVYCRVIQQIRNAVIKRLNEMRRK